MLEYITTKDLVEDTKNLIHLVPQDATCIAGSPRSGLIPASVLSTLLQLPLYAIEQNGHMVHLSGGGRGSAQKSKKKPFIVDDTMYTGQRMKKLKTVAPIRSVFAVVYSTFECMPLVDHVVRSVQSPHLLEWNLFNNQVICGKALDTKFFRAGVGMDFDGVLCQDCPVDDKKEDEYIEWMRTAKPKYLPRLHPVPLVVTFRLEKYRTVTEEWLGRHGVRVKRLVMHPASSNQERDRGFMNEITKHKGEEFKNSELGLFIESNCIQAQLIAQHAKKPVLCTDNGRIYR